MKIEAKLLNLGGIWKAESMKVVDRLTWEEKKEEGAAVRILCDSSDQFAHSPTRLSHPACSLAPNRPPDLSVSGPTVWGPLE